MFPGYSSYVGIHNKRAIIAMICILHSCVLFPIVLCFCICVLSSSDITLHIIQYREKYRKTYKKEA